jgi:hypothetical protein
MIRNKSIGTVGMKGRARRNLSFVFSLVVGLHQSVSSCVNPFVVELIKLTARAWGKSKSLAWLLIFGDRFHFICNLGRVSSP